MTNALKHIHAMADGDDVENRRLKSINQFVCLIK